MAREIAHESEYYRSLGDRLRSTREHIGINQRTMAWNMPLVRKQHISNIERGATRPSATDLAMYVRLGKVDPYWLLLGDDDDTIEWAAEPDVEPGLTENRGGRPRRLPVAPVPLPELVEPPPPEPKPTWRPEAWRKTG